MLNCLGFLTLAVHHLARGGKTNWDVIGSRGLGLLGVEELGGQSLSLRGYPSDSNPRTRQTTGISSYKVKGKTGTLTPVPVRHWDRHARTETHTYAYVG